eukprot:Nitzschia sp. Nitz4//scaffold10_size219509//175817//176872//NITZ4_001454-RA/size219509-processed-gene-0.146-mRNA-1//-1//CDS//3329532998//2350//frame0
MATKDLGGVWQRQSEEDPIGDHENADRDTLVWWIQAPKSGMYVDIRLPLGAPGRRVVKEGSHRDPSALEARGLSFSPNLSETDVELILRQKSFAGYLHYSVGDTTSGQALKADDCLRELADNATEHQLALKLCTCYWERAIDYQPPTGELDIGVCASSSPNDDGSIDLRETGSDGSYAEDWHRLPGSNGGPSFAAQLVSEHRAGFWVRTGQYFAYAIGRPTNTSFAAQLQCHEASAQIHQQVGPSLIENLRQLGNDPLVQLQVSGTYVCVCGEITGSGEWMIRYSTHPDLLGTVLAGPGPYSCSSISATSFGGQPCLGAEFIQTLTPSGSQRRWKVLECEGDVALPFSITR